MKLLNILVLAAVALASADKESLVGRDGRKARGGAGGGAPKTAGGNHEWRQRHQRQLAAREEQMRQRQLKREN